MLINAVEFKTGKGHSFWVSQCDVAQVSLLKPFCTSEPSHSRNKYVIGRGQILIHRAILGAGKNQIVDHVDGNGMNCTRENIRIVTHQQNMWNRKKNLNNRSGFIGVSETKRKNPLRKPWKSCICHNGKIIYLGRYETPEEAASVYDEKCAELRGKFAALNFPAKHEAGI